jgi:hypothetical protein
MTLFTRLLQMFVFVLFAVSSTAATAGALSSESTNSDFAKASSVSDQELDTMRGGMLDSNGLLISGLWTNMVFQNGSMVGNNTVAIENLLAGMGGLPVVDLNNTQDNQVLDTISVLNMDISGAGSLYAAQAAINTTQQVNIGTLGAIK